MAAGEIGKTRVRVRICRGGGAGGFAVAQTSPDLRPHFFFGLLDLRAPRISSTPAGLFRLADRHHCHDHIFCLLLHFLSRLLFQHALLSSHIQTSTYSPLAIMSGIDFDLEEQLRFVSSNIVYTNTKPV